MIWIYIIPILALIIVICLFFRQSENDKKDGVLFSLGNCLYCGGFYEIEGGKETTITIYDNRVILTILKSSNNFYSGYSKTLYISNIENIGIKSETQIRSEISLGKMIMFGIFSLAMKNDKTITTNYLVIDYNSGDDITSIILNADSNEEIIELINKLKRGN